jgi:AcrR family transcriptional regulator
MTKSNLDYYFRDKEEILFACHGYALDLLLKVLERVMSRDYTPEEKLRQLIAAFVHTMLDELGGTSLTTRRVNSLAITTPDQSHGFPCPLTQRLDPQTTSAIASLAHSSCL